MNPTSTDPIQLAEECWMRGLSHDSYLYHANNLNVSPISADDYRTECAKLDASYQEFNRALSEQFNDQLRSLA